MPFQDDPDKIAKLYNFLKKNKVRVHDNVEDFRTAMNDDKHVKTVFDHLQKQHPEALESRDIESFKTNLGLKKKEDTVVSPVSSSPAGQALESGLTEDQEKQRNLQQLSQQPVASENQPVPPGLANLDISKWN
jgi:benzoyl-CoA reductase/2-hydroxyglutaryl-CoA dehydratase subunit BcrC/BadD/HgdB